MLEDCLVESRRSVQKRKPFTFAFATILHCSIVGLLVLAPLIQLQVMPQVRGNPPLPPFRMPSGPRFIETKPIRSGNRTGSAIRSSTLTSPRVIPTTIAHGADIPEPEPIGLGIAHSFGPGGPFTIPGFAPGFDPPPPPPPVPAPPPPPPPPPPPVILRNPIRVSGGVQQANLIYQLTPTYPPLARTARVQGVVVIEAVITKEGAVGTVRLIYGHPLLVQSALDAVRQWRYRPTTLNGEAVEVITTITVNFVMGN